MARTKQTARGFTTGGKAPRKSHSSKVNGVNKNANKNALVDLDRLTVPKLKEMLVKFNIEFSSISGTGKNGNVVKADIIAALDFYLDNTKQLLLKPEKEHEKEAVKPKPEKKVAKPKPEKYDVLTFVFEYERGKPVELIHRITRGDYEVFYGIVSEFFTGEITEGEFYIIRKVYPDIKDNGQNFQELFNRIFISTGVTQLEKNKYMIEWAT
jgi:hypothetical protein